MSCIFVFLFSVCSIADLFLSHSGGTCLSIYQSIGQCFLLSRSQVSMSLLGMDPIVVWYLFKGWSPILEPMVLNTKLFSKVGCRDDWDCIECMQCVLLLRRHVTCLVACDSSVDGISSPYIIIIVNGVVRIEQAKCGFGVHLHRVQKVQYFATLIAESAIILSRPSNNDSLNVWPIVKEHFELWFGLSDGDGLARTALLLQRQFHVILSDLNRKETGSLVPFENVCDFGWARQEIRKRSLESKGFGKWHAG